MPGTRYCLFFSLNVGSVLSHIWIRWDFILSVLRQFHLLCDYGNILSMKLNGQFRFIRASLSTYCFRWMLFPIHVREILTNECQQFSWFVKPLFIFVISYLRECEKVAVAFFPLAPVFEKQHSHRKLIMFVCFIHLNLMCNLFLCCVSICIFICNMCLCWSSRD